MQNARLDESQAGINITGRNINCFRYANTTTLMAKSEEELKNLLMKVKEESEKVKLPKSLPMVTAAKKLKDTYSLEKKLRIT